MKERRRIHTPLSMHFSIPLLLWETSNCLVFPRNRTEKYGGKDFASIFFHQILEKLLQENWFSTGIFYLLAVLFKKHL